MIFISTICLYVSSDVCVLFYCLCASALSNQNLAGHCEAKDPGFFRQITNALIDRLDMQADPSIH